MKYIKQNSKILNLIEKNNHEKAIKILEKDINSNKNIGLNFLTLAEIYLLDNEYDAAIATLEKSHSYINFTHKDFLFEIFSKLGELYYKSDSYKKAFLIYQKALNIKKNDHELLSKIGTLYIDVKKIPDALKIFQYLSAKTEEPKYKSLLAYTYLKSEEYEKGEQILNSILEKSPSNTLAHFYLGYSAYEKKNNSKALKEIEIASADKELRFKCRYYAGKINMETSNYNHAIENFSEAVKKINIETRMTLDLHYSLALCYEHQKKYLDSLEQLRIIHNINPDYKDINEKLISDNYKNLSKDYLIEYNSYSAKEFLNFAQKFISKINLSPMSHKLKEPVNIITFQCKANENKNKQNIIQKFVSFSKNEKVLVVFCRDVLVRENTIEEIIKTENFKFDKGILLSSTNVSSLAQNFAKEHKIKIIIPTFLNDIIKDLNK